MVDPKILLHPERLQILSELSTHPRTTKWLQAQLPNIAQASLYRHIKTLSSADVIRVAQTAKINGAEEKSYILNQEMTQADPDHIERMSGDELTAYFNIFVANLARILARFARHSPIGTRQSSGLSFNQVTLHLTTEQLNDLKSRMSDLVQDVAAQQNLKTGRPYFLASTTLPMEHAHDDS